MPAPPDHAGGLRLPPVCRHAPKTFLPDLSSISRKRSSISRTRAYVCNAFNHRQRASSAACAQPPPRRRRPSPAAHYTWRRRPRSWTDTGKWPATGPCDCRCAAATAINATASQSGRHLSRNSPAKKVIINRSHCPLADCRRLTTKITVISCRKPSDSMATRRNSYTLRCFALNWIQLRQPHEALTQLIVCLVTVPFQPCPNAVILAIIWLQHRSPYSFGRDVVCFVCCQPMTTESFTR